MSLPFFILLLTLLSLTLLQASPTSGTRPILRALSGESGGGAGDPDSALDVNATNFAQVLRHTPAAYAIVEFFANWCPACRKYGVQYEKVATLFNGHDAVHPGILMMARVDCGLEINTILCLKFSVSHYPMLLWGSPSKFAAGSEDPQKIASDFLAIDDVRKADHLLNWINQQLNSSYGLDDHKIENVHPSNISEIAQALSDVEEATTTFFDIILQQKMIKNETRASLIKFLQLLVVHHPSRRCRRGSAEILVNFDDLCPPNIMSYDILEDLDIGDKKGALENIKICGKEVPRGYWMFCRGSTNDTRGFSCGLWVLLHSLSVRIGDGESQNAFTAVCDFIHNFFICEECRQHFYGMCSSVSIPFNNTHDFALWLWSAHNKVNERLLKEEASLRTGDPQFPKIAWPPRHLCSSCYQDSSNGSSQIEWNKEEVFKLLSSYYGRDLVSLDKDKGLVDNERSIKVVDDLAAAVTTNAVVVPVGAALAVALASCAFGAMAFYWRAKQKNRKPRRSWT